MNLGDKIDRLFELRGMKDELNGKLSEINKEIDQIEYTLLTQMDDAGVTQAKSDRGSIAVKVDLYPQVTDITKLVTWAQQNGRPEILQRRVSSAVFKEIFENTGEYPEGIDAYQKKTFNYRKAK